MPIIIIAQIFEKLRKNKTPKNGVKSLFSRFARIIRCTYNGICHSKF